MINERQKLYPPGYERPKTLGLRHGLAGAVFTRASYFFRALRCMMLEKSLAPLPPLWSSVYSSRASAPIFESTPLELATSIARLRSFTIKSTMLRPQTMRTGRERRRGTADRAVSRSLS